MVLPFGQAVVHSVLTSALRDVPAGNHGICINPLGLDIRFDEYNCHDSLEANLIEEFGHSLSVTLHTDESLCYS